MDRHRAGQPRRLAIGPRRAAGERYTDGAAAMSILVSYWLVYGALIVTPGFLAGAGEARTGQWLTADPGEWGPDGVALSYQWFRGTHAVSTGTTVTPGAAGSAPSSSVNTTPSHGLGWVSGAGVPGALGARRAGSRRPQSSMGPAPIAGSASPS